MMRHEEGPGSGPTLFSLGGTVVSYGWLVGGTVLGLPPGALLGLPLSAGGPGV